MSRLSVTPFGRSATVCACALIASLAAPAAAQTARPVERVQELRARVEQTPTELDQQRAEVTREELRELMRRYPPALGRVLRADPSLLSNSAYLAPYPALSTYLQRHPEIARYPDYFLNYFGYDYQEPQPPEVEMRRATMNMWRDMFFSVMVFTGLLSAVLSVGWLIRYVVGHRRWLRSVKVQTDVHTRLMERFASNDELMTYIQSPAGRQFLQGLPAAPEMASSPIVSPPLTRIMWSVQAGVVLVCAGAGLLTIKRYMVDEVAEMLLVWGVLSLSVGVGFVLAAGASYILSERLGLFDAAQGGGTKGA
jgi:hypothetical protein